MRWPGGDVQGDEMVISVARGLAERGYQVGAGAGINIADDDVGAVGGPLARAGGAEAGCACVKG